MQFWPFPRIFVVFELLSSVEWLKTPFKGRGV